jgi:probable phosphomutase (TIGR03848 family)
MTTYLLIRHAANDMLGKGLAGRMPGIHLNEKGQGQAQRLVRRLADIRIKFIYSSPLERAQETAEPLVKELGLPLILAEQLTEIDFGQWTGKSFCELESDTHWQRFNAVRSCCRPPLGELITEVQTRITSYLEQLCHRHQNDTVALITHADVIRAALCYHLGIPLDLMQRLEVSPASISELVLDDFQPRLVRLNDTA